jgi:hypothetical protein
VAVLPERVITAYRRSPPSRPQRRFSDPVAGGTNILQRYFQLDRPPKTLEANIFLLKSEARPRSYTGRLGNPDRHVPELREPLSSLSVQKHCTAFDPEENH